MKRKMKIEMYQDKRKEWRWRIIASNGKIVAVSGEGYKRKASMKKTLQRLLFAFTNGVWSSRCSGVYTKEEE